MLALRTAVTNYIHLLNGSVRDMNIYLHELIKCVFYSVEIFISSKPLCFNFFYCIPKMSYFFSFLQDNIDSMNQPAALTLS